MIVDHINKYIFIGIPFSASSAISKELLDVYGGQPLLHKHANMPLLEKLYPDLDFSQYTIFAVVRDPVEAAFSWYNKFLTNAHSVYTDARYFVENGGHISKKERIIYRNVHKSGLNFEEFLEYVYKWIPYDSYLSENRDYINEFIRFSNLREDFMSVLKKIGLEPVRPLPLHNKTNKKEKLIILSEKTKRKVFGSYYCYNTKFYNQESWGHAGAFQRLKFLLFRRLRSMKTLQRDKHQLKVASSMVD